MLSICLLLLLVVNCYAQTPVPFVLTRSESPITLETNHSYFNLEIRTNFIQFQSTNYYKFIFDSRTVTEDMYDIFYIKKGNYIKNHPANSGKDLVSPMSGAGAVWSNDIIVESKKGLTVCFQSDRNNKKWGIKVRIEPYYPR